jgi:hypothetical protein
MKARRRAFCDRTFSRLPSRLAEHSRAIAHPKRSINVSGYLIARSGSAVDVSID